MLKSREIKAIAKKAMLPHKKLIYGGTIIILILYNVIKWLLSNMGDSSDIISLAVDIFVFGIFGITISNFFLQLVRENGADAKIVYDIMPDYGKKLAVNLLRTVYLVLWTLLFVIVSVIIIALASMINRIISIVLLTIAIIGLFVFITNRTYLYSLAPYVYADNPNLSAGMILAKSVKLMKGNVWKKIRLDLSFWPWVLANVFTYIVTVMTIALASLEYVDFGYFMEPLLTTASTFIGTIVIMNVAGFIIFLISVYYIPYQKASEAVFYGETVNKLNALYGGEYTIN